MSKLQNDEYQTLILAALSHDIGKFWQRTGKKHEDEYNVYTEDDYGKHGAHAKWSLNFFDDKLKFIKKFFSEQDWKECRESILRHHKPQYSRLERVIHLADRLSAGEREEREEEKDPSKEPLISIFSRLFEENCLQEWCLPTKKLSLSRNTLMPQPSKEHIVVNYHKLWEEFESEISSLPSNDINSFLFTFYFLLMKYTWCIPSAVYRDIPDISLFDHLKTTAAISLCLHKLQEELLSKIEERWGEDPILLLLGGDLSGIQKFIYTISQEGAVKTLRGRSLYLRLLMEEVASFIIEQLGLFLSNIIYNSGGHFYMLVPLSAKDILPKLKEKINKNLLEFHKGNLYLNLAYIELCPNDFDMRKRRLQSKWHELSKKISEEKRKKFLSLCLSEFNTIFGPFGEGGTKNICKACHEEISRGEECELCESFEWDIGFRLKEAKFIVEERPGKERGYNKILAGFDKLIRLEKDEKKKNAINIFAINDTTIKGCGFKFIAKVIPWKEERIATFEELAESSIGVKRWGVLRADVDNLGEIFKCGFGGKASISRLATLSFQLSLFFEGYLNEICAPYSDHLYLIYSGGDDLFMVGSWDKIIEISQKIREEFAEFTCHNPKITLSCGITLQHKKFPLYKAAENAKTSLDTSKEYQKNNVQKNAITLFGTPLSWSEFKKVLEIKDILLPLIDRGRDEKKLPRGFLQKLYSIYWLYYDNKKNRQSKDISYDKLKKLVMYEKWRWRLIYNISKQDEVFKEDLERLQKILIDEEVIDYLNVPVRIIELLTRKEE